MTNLSEKFLSNLIQRGYNYVDSGFCVWADWKQEMSSFLHASNNDLLDLSETDINDIIQFVWNQSAQVRKSVDGPPGMLTEDHHHTVHEERQVCYSSHLRPKSLHL